MEVERAMQSTRTMTPLPKYLAVSNTAWGMRALIQRFLRAKTGKAAPAIEVAMMMKMDAMRSPVLSFVFPVNVHSSDMTGCGAAQR